MRSRGGGAKEGGAPHSAAEALEPLPAQRMRQGPLEGAPHWAATAAPTGPWRGVRGPYTAGQAGLAAGAMPRENWEAQRSWRWPPPARAPRRRPAWWRGGVPASSSLPRRAGAPLPPPQAATRSAVGSWCAACLAPPRIAAETPRGAGAFARGLSGTQGCTCVSGGAGSRVGHPGHRHAQRRGRVALAPGGPSARQGGISANLEPQGRTMWRRAGHRPRPPNGGPT